MKLALADVPRSERNFEDLPLRNPFLGMQPPVKERVIVETPPDGPDVRRYVSIDTIEHTTQQAFLRNILYKSRSMRIKSAPGSGYDVFQITDEDGEKVVVRGKVLRIDPRDVFFQVGEDVYDFHFSQTLAEAMKRPLSELELDRYELTDLVDPEFAQEETPAAKDAPKKTSPASRKTKTGTKKKSSQ